MDWLWKGKDEVTFETTKDRKRHERIKNIRRFVIAAVALAIIAAVLVLKQYDFDLSGASNKTEETTEPETETTQKVKYATGKKTFMVYCTDDNEKEVQFLMLIRADMDQSFVKIHPMNVSEEIYSCSGVGVSKKVNASTCFLSGGSGMLKEACENYFGIKVDKYFGIDASDFENITVNFRNVTLNIPNTVTLTKNGDSESFEAGKQDITNRALYKYMTYDGFGSADDKMTAQAEGMKAMIDQYITDSFIDNINVIFSRIINLADSDISVIDVRNNIRSLRFIANKDSDFKCETVLSGDEFKNSVIGG